MVLMNYVELRDNVPKVLHFSDHYWVERMIWDKDLEKEKPVRSLVFAVDWEDGEVAIRTFSVLSRGLALQFEPYLQESRFRDFLFTVTKTGRGFATHYTVEAKPLPPDVPV